MSTDMCCSSLAFCASVSTSSSICRICGGVSGSACSGTSRPLTRINGGRVGFRCRSEAPCLVMIRSSSSICCDGTVGGSVAQQLTAAETRRGWLLLTYAFLPPKLSSMGAPLTERQKAILDFFAEFHRRHGYPPTHREIRDRFGYTSYGTVHKHLRLLREKGYLAGEQHQKRGLRLAPSEETVAPELPFLGRIAAGRPIEAIAGQDRLAVPPSLLHGPIDDHYVLRVVGDSMIEEGIHDGDLVVVRRRDQATPG